MFFDKDKVQLQIEVDGRTTYQPGQAIIGRLKVEVLKEVQITAIRLLARAKETTSFDIKKKGGGKQHCEQSYIHFQHLITFFGFSKECGRTGGASLEAGSYEYPFQFVLPASAPPSYHCRISTGSSELAYVLRATVDIPRGFDGKKELSLVVVPTIAAQQYAQLQNMTKSVVNQRIAVAIDPGCCGRNKDPAAAMDVSAEVPAVALLQSSNDANMVHSGAAGETLVRVRLTLRNLCKKASIRYVRVSLQQHQRLLAQGETADGINTVATVEVSPPSGELIPRAQTSFEVSLRLPDALRHSSKMSDGSPLPTMATPCMQVENFITVNFPGLGAEAVVPISDVMPIVAAVDPTSSVPMVPCSYFQNTILPEEKLGAE